MKLDHSMKKHCYRDLRSNLMRLHPTSSKLISQPFHDANTCISSPVNITFAFVVRGPRRGICDRHLLETPAKPFTGAGKIKHPFSTPSRNLVESEVIGKPVSSWQRSISMMSSEAVTSQATPFQSSRDYPHRPDVTLHITAK